MVNVEHLKISYDESVALSNFHRDELLQMIQDLPLGCQVIFNMYAIEGYTHKEIAEKLDISEGTSKSQYSRARSLLQLKLKESDRGNYERAER
jgi:RNA polymerase sigma-70 factor (ECF subfamily)